jgi:outer membrane protein with beta-barrel domain
MHARTFIFALMGASLAAVPAIGSAQDGEPAEPRDLTSLGEYVLLGGGATNFTKDVPKNRFDVGGTWDARLGVGNRFYVGAEAAYVGAALPGSGAGPDLTMNGAEAVIRLQIPYATGRWLVEPFAFGGIGWNHLSLDNAAPGLKSSDDVGVVPFGAGLGVGYDRLFLDARFTYRTSFSEDLALAPNEPAADLQRWSIGASIGYEF